MHGIDYRHPILHNVGIVMNRRAKLAILLVLLAASAFALDVLSPATQTPIAQLAKAFGFGLFLLVLMAPFKGFLNELVGRRTICPEFRTTKPSSRLLLTLMCFLLF